MSPSATEISFQRDEVKKKTFLLILLSFLSALIYWKIITLNLVDNEIQNGAGWPSVICPFLFFGLYKLNEKLTDNSWIVGLLMAICIGIFFGAISGFFEKGADGLIIQAVLTTFGSVFSIIYLYKNKIITVNNKFLHFTAFVFSTLIWVATADFILSFIVLGWNSFFVGVTPIAIGLNAIVLLLAYLVFTIDLNIIDEKINAGSISKNQTWAFSIELLIDVGWIYFAVIFLILRLRGRSNR